MQIELLETAQFDSLSAWDGQFVRFLENSLHGKSIV